MVGVIENLFNVTYYFSDIAVVAGMGMALNADYTKDKVNDFVVNIQEHFVLGKKTAPQQILRTVKSKAPTWTYKIIKAFLLFGAVYNVLSNIFMTTPRHPIINLVYLYYSLLTAYVSAYDILLDDDKSLWSKELKIRHVMWPMNLEAGKVLANDMNKTERDWQVLKPMRALKDDGFYFGAYTAAAGILYAILPPALYFVVCPFVFLAHNKGNMVFNSLFEMFTIYRYNNKFESFFGDFFGVMKGEAHEMRGKQYQYFLYSFKPMEKLLDKTVFMKAKNKYRMNTGEAKAAYFVARGMLVTALLFTMNLINTKLLGDDVNKVVGLMGGLAPYAMYYGIHAYLAWSNHVKGTSLWFDETWKRAIPCAGEMLLSGMLFYNPILQRLFR